MIPYTFIGRRPGKTSLDKALKQARFMAMYGHDPMARWAARDAEAQATLAEVLASSEERNLEARVMAWYAQEHAWRHEVCKAVRQAMNLPTEEKP